MRRSSRTRSRHEQSLTGGSFTYQIPTNTFVDPDTGATLEYAATLADSGALPAWLMLSTSGVFSSASVPDDAEDLSLLVTVTDDMDAAGDMAAPFTLTDQHRGDGS